VVELSATAVDGPMGLVAALANREMNSPGETAPVAKLAPLLTELMTGSGAVTVRVTLTMVVPVAGLVPCTVMVPVYGDDAGVKVESTLELIPAVRLNVPVLGVVPDPGVTVNQLAELAAVAVNAAAAPPPETEMVPVGLALPTVYARLRVVGEAVTVTEEETIKVTWITCAVPPVGVIVTVP